MKNQGNLQTALAVFPPGLVSGLVRLGFGKNPNVDSKETRTRPKETPKKNSIYKYVASVEARWEFGDG